MKKIKINRFPTWNGFFVADSRDDRRIRRFKTRKGAMRCASYVSYLLDMAADIVDCHDIRPDLPFRYEKPFLVRVHVSGDTFEV